MNNVLIKGNVMWKKNIHKVAVKAHAIWQI